MHPTTAQKSPSRGLVALMGLLSWLPITISAGPRVDYPDLFSSPFSVKFTQIQAIFSSPDQIVEVLEDGVVTIRKEGFTVNGEPQVARGKLHAESQLPYYEVRLANEFHYMAENKYIYLSTTLPSDPNDSSLSNRTSWLVAVADQGEFYELHAQDRGNGQLFSLNPIKDRKNPEAIRTWQLSRMLEYAGGIIPQDPALYVNQGEYLEFVHDSTPSHYRLRALPDTYPAITYMASPNASRPLYLLETEGLQEFRGVTFPEHATERNSANGIDPQVLFEYRDIHFEELTLGEFDAKWHRFYGQFREREQRLAAP